MGFRGYNWIKYFEFVLNDSDDFIGPFQLQDFSGIILREACV